jgi:hypothetical protein
VKEVSELYVRQLVEAREQAVEARRTLVAALAEPYERGHTEQLREEFIKLQEAIEAIDRALADEHRIAGKSDPMTLG